MTGRGWHRRRSAGKQPGTRSSRCIARAISSVILCWTKSSRSACRRRSLSPKASIRSSRSWNASPSAAPYSSKAGARSVAAGDGRAEDQRPVDGVAAGLGMAIQRESSGSAIRLGRRRDIQVLADDQLRAQLVPDSAGDGGQRLASLVGVDEGQVAGEDRHTLAEPARLAPPARVAGATPSAGRGRSARRAAAASRPSRRRGSGRRRAAAPARRRRQRRRVAPGRRRRRDSRSGRTPGAAACRRRRSGRPTRRRGPPRGGPPRTTGRVPAASRSCSRSSTRLSRPSVSDGRVRAAAVMGSAVVGVTRPAFPDSVRRCVDGAVVSTLPMPFARLGGARPRSSPSMEMSPRSWPRTSSSRRNRARPAGPPVVDEDLRRAGAGADTDRRTPSSQLSSGRSTSGTRCAATPRAGHLHHPHRVAGVARPDDQHEVAVARRLLDRVLPVLAGVADVVVCRAREIVETSPARRCTSAVSSIDRVVWVRYATGASRGRSRRSTSSTSATTIVRSGASPCVPSISSWSSCPIEQDDPAVAGVHAGPPGAPSATSGQVASMTRAPLRGVLADRRGDPVRGEDADRALGYLLLGVHEARAPAFQIRDDVVVVHDLLADVDRRCVLAQRLLDDLDRSDHARAETAWLGEHDAAALPGTAGLGHHFSLWHTRIPQPMSVGRRLLA